MTTTLSLLVVMCCLQVPDDVKDLLDGEAYSVTWNNPDIPDPQMTLDVGTGSGHGGKLHWLRFQPEKVHVEVLAITYDESHVKYRSKWPPDGDFVKVQRGLITKDAYSTLLTKIGWLKAATIKPKKMMERESSTADFWVSIYGVWKTVPVLDYDWAGYQNSDDEPKYAVPRAMGALAAKAIKSANAKSYDVTAADRQRASVRFNRDWMKFEKSSSHWWVRYRALNMIGVIGDEAVYPTLRTLLERFDSNDRKTFRPTYYAINAVTRLTKKDVRTKPVEEMDLKENAAKVLALIKPTP